MLILILLYPQGLSIWSFVWYSVIPVELPGTTGLYLISVSFELLSSQFN